MEARRAHNPEVVGSSPASATIKTPDFDKKSGVFLTFQAKTKWSRIDFDPILTPIGAPKSFKYTLKYGKKQICFD